jgi:hypothetical protein
MMKAIASGRAICHFRLVLDGEVHLELCGTLGDDAIKKSRINVPIAVLVSVNVLLDWTEHSLRLRSKSARQTEIGNITPNVASRSTRSSVSAASFQKTKRPKDELDPTDRGREANPPWEPVSFPSLDETKDWDSRVRKPSSTKAQACLIKKVFIITGLCNHVGGSRRTVRHERIKRFMRDQARTPSLIFSK